MPSVSDHVRLQLGVALWSGHNSVSHTECFRAILFASHSSPTHLQLHSHNSAFLPPRSLKTMPRTKQTAKKSTGGLAKRKLLQQVAYTPRSRSSRSRSARQSPNPAADVEMAVEPSTSEFLYQSGSDVHTNGSALQVLPHRLVEIVSRL